MQTFNTYRRRIVLLISLCVGEQRYYITQYALAKPGDMEMFVVFGRTQTQILLVNSSRLMYDKTANKTLIQTSSYGMHKSVMFHRLCVRHCQYL